MKNHILSAMIRKIICCWLVPVSASVFILPISVQAGRFNPAFLSKDPGAVADLSRLENSQSMLPGKYRVDIYLNGNAASSRTVEFLPPVKKDGNLIACLSRADLETLGVNPHAVTQFVPLAQAENCLDLAATMPQAKAELDPEKLQLNISVPQAMLQQNARGYIPPEQWDNGITALLLNYDFSGSHDEGDDASNSNYLNLQSGLNVGPWRLRDYSTWSYSSDATDGAKSHWEHASTVVQRTIIPLGAELTLGDGYTPAEVFDSLGFRGVQLATDDSMAPDSLRGFAPIIRGVAKSNAQVTIKQNNYTIYQTYVPQGAFEIKDLFPTSSSGDLTVTIKETDGSENTFTVPYAAVPILQREGRVKYALTAARFRTNSDDQDEPQFAQGTLIWGLPYGITAYGGAQYSDNYRAFAGGLGLNLGTLGAVSLDVTQANSILADDSHHDGQSLRFLYSKTFNTLGTNFQIMGYRYSTQGFYTLDETTWKNMRGARVDFDGKDDDYEPVWSDYYNLYNNKRGKLQLNISQPLGGLGSVYIGGSQQTYWGMSEKESLLQFGYSGNYKGVSYNISYSYNKSPQSDSDRMVAFSISVPLSQWLSSSSSDSLYSGNTATANYSVSTDSGGQTSHSAGVSGTLLDDHNLNYSVQQNVSNDAENSYGGNANMTWRGTYGTVKAGYNYDDNGSSQVNYGLSGGVVVHANGVTLSQPLGDTNVLIKAPGANGVQVDNGTGVKTDWRGYAVLPYATSYRHNRISLNAGTMDEHVDLESTATDVVPTKGALVRAEFAAHVGLRVLFTLNHQGKPVPFGATVSLKDGGSASIVGDNGQAYLAGLPLSGSLEVSWGNGAGEQCRTDYQLAESELTKTISKITLKCGE